MEGALFNPGFLGSHFLWWVGQVAPDKTWRENVQNSNFKDPEEIPGWGYRYKVRIMGLHDKDDADIPDDQLPWAQVMYPVTAGGGQLGSQQTPGIRQGNFVFGFFLDGQDQQVPVIMGVLGNNAKTKIPNLKFHTYAATAGEANEDEDPDKKTADSNQSVVKKSPPIRAGVDAVHQKVVATVKQDATLSKKIALACPDPEKNSAMKGIQTVMQQLSQDIERIQKSLEFFESAAGLPIVQAQKSIDEVIEGSAEELTKFMGEIMGRVQQFTMDQYSKQLQQMLKLAPPTAGLSLRILEIAGLAGIAASFNGITSKLLPLILNALKKGFKNKKNSSPSSSPTSLEVESGVELPPVPEEGYYSPTPMCSTEELMGEVLGGTINDILKSYDEAIAPAVVGAEDATTAGGSSEGSKAAGSSPFKISGLSNLIDGFGALKGLAFDISSALGFISEIASFFPTDFKPVCSPNDTHTMGGSGSGKSMKNIPSVESVTKKATEVVGQAGKVIEKPDEVIEKVVTEKKKFIKPSIPKKPPTPTITTREETIDTIKGEKFSEDALESIRRIRLAAVRQFNDTKSSTVRARLSNTINRYNEHLDLPQISLDDVYNFDYKIKE